MIADPAVRERVCERFPVLGEGPESLRRAFFGAAVHVRVPAGRWICSEGMTCEHLALVVGGTVRVFKTAATGREVTLYRIAPGDSCILTASCILAGRDFPAIALAETDVEAVALPAAAVRPLARAEPDWMEFLFGLVAARIGQVIAVLEEMAFRRMDARVADHLLARAGADGVVAQTHQAIAADLGTAREVVTRTLRDLEDRGLVALGRGRVEIRDRPALEALARR